MRIAVSIPDNLFRQAVRAARQLRVSRSQLFAQAIAEFLDRRRASDITECLNKVYSRQPAKVDSALVAVQRKSLENDSW